MQRGPVRNQEIDFLQAKRLLFILTGVEPIRTHGKIDKIHEGEHLRFVFNKSIPEFYLVVAMLKLLDIQHCSELFKDSVSPIETYITVSKRQFNKVYSYFAPGAFVNLKAQGNQIDFFEFQGGFQLAFINILFNSSFLDSIKTRNQGEYNLDGLMGYFGQILIHSAPCFAHLKEGGVTVDYTISLNVEEESSEEIRPVRRAITPLRNNQANKTSVSSPPPRPSPYNSPNSRHRL
jgi:hypothetical protein